MEGCFVDVTDHLHYSQASGGVTSDVFVDARHLRYCDAHTVGLLDRTARALSGKRRLVVLYQPRIMRRLLSVAGVADRDRAARSVLIARYAAGEVGRCVRAWWERIGP